MKPPPPQPASSARRTSLPDYIELQTVSNFSFLRGASHPEELVQRALALGYCGLAITDDCSLAGVVRAHLALREARKAGVPGADAFQLLIGSQFEVRLQPDGPVAFTLVVLACHRLGYGLLSEFITRLRRAQAGKGQAPLCRDAIDPAALGDCLVLMAPVRSPQAPSSPQPVTDAVTDAASAAPSSTATTTIHNASDDDLTRILPHARWLRERFAGRCGLILHQHHELSDARWLRTLREVAELSRLTLVAAGDAHMHVRSRKPLQDVLTAIRLGLALPQCGLALQRHAERHLRSRLRMAQRHPADTLAATLTLAEQCHFSLDELKYEYPQEIVPAGQTPTTHLRALTEQGCRERFPQGEPPAVREQIEKELALITQLGYEKYFLTVHDIVRFANERGILCQGRGSAANSTVCYCLGITAVSPQETTLLFERFISRERDEPPDIDVDFEHAHREEVIQYLYAKYGRDRTALTATVISYRTRSAIRDVGKALGYPLDLVERVTRHHHHWDGSGMNTERLQELGLDIGTRRIRQWMELADTLTGFPRHLSQHTGGFVISGDALCRTVPIENATMPGRSVIQWDKDDLDALGLLKVDVLALGMLTALRKAMDFIAQWRGLRLQLYSVPPDDAPTYAMVSAADTIGVFQIESRAQMSMLPRLRPANFYDLVVEVALVRPGPIQGDMVHPYLERRALHAQNPAAITYPPGLKPALARTLGVPIFQEQVMQIAVDGAGFTPGEADELRRSMAAWKRKGGVKKFKDKFVAGMLAHGHELDFAERIFRQIEGFGEYGFPESHAASFAKLVYVSAWIKCHEPAAFLAGLLNAQPLGFYSPSQLVQDARRHGVAVRPPDVCHSDWDCTLETPSGTPITAPRGTHPQPAVRLGLRQVKGLSAEAAQRLLCARQQCPFSDVEDLARRAGLDQGDMRALASGDALMSLAGHRRQQVWAASALHRAPALLREAPVHEDALQLPSAQEGEEVVFDYASLGLTLRRHPLDLLRPQLQAQRLWTAAHMHDFPNGRLARACGIVTGRQQPATASGVVFVTLEDETGHVNVVVWRDVRERFRDALLRSRLMAVYGVWQREGEVRHLVAQHLRDLTPLLGELVTHSRDFH